MPPLPREFEGQEAPQKKTSVFAQAALRDLPLQRLEAGETRAEADDPAEKSLHFDHLDCLIFAFNKASMAASISGTSHMRPMPSAPQAT